MGAEKINGNRDKVIRVSQGGLSEEERNCSQCSGLADK